MILEDYFRRPGTIARYRLPPLGPLTRLRRFDPISCYFRCLRCDNPLIVLAPETRNRL